MLFLNRIATPLLADFGENSVVASARVSTRRTGLIVYAGIGIGKGNDVLLLLMPV